MIVSITVVHIDMHSPVCRRSFYLAKARGRGGSPILGSPAGRLGAGRRQCGTPPRTSELFTRRIDDDLDHVHHVDPIVDLKGCCAGSA